MEGRGTGSAVERRRDDTLTYAGGSRLFVCVLFLLLDCLPVPCLILFLPSLPSSSPSLPSSSHPWMGRRRERAFRLKEKRGDNHINTRGKKKKKKEKETGKEERRRR